MRKLFFLSVLVLPLLECATLDPIAAGTCGNHVIEAAEDCDGFPREAATTGPGSAACGRPGSVAECRLLCDTARDACPAGWGCGQDGICREPKGVYEAVESTPTNGTRLQVGDFDGDDQKDLFVSGVATPTTAAVLYFGDDGRIGRRFPINMPIRTPQVVAFPGDAHDDIVFSGFEDIAVALGQPDGTLEPVTYPRVFPKMEVVGVTLRPRDPAGAPPGALAAVAGIFDAGWDKGGGDPGLPGTRLLGFSPEGKRAQSFTVLREYAPGPSTKRLTDVLAGFPETGRLFSAADRFGDFASSCGEVAAPLLAENVVRLATMCRRHKDAVFAEWSTAALGSGLEIHLLPDIKFRPAQRGLSQVVFFADMDADGREDVIVKGALGATPRAQYTLATPPDFLAEPRPFKRAELDGASGDVVDAGFLEVEVLGVGDFDRDGVPDLVASDGLYRGVGAGKKGQPKVLAFLRTSDNRGTPWSVGAVGDLNGDGYLDVIAGTVGSPNVDFFAGGPPSVTQEFARSTIPTTSLRALALGDFDSDNVLDLGIATDTGTTDEVTISIAYGRRQGRPEAPARVATVRGFVQLVALDFGGFQGMAAVSNGADATKPSERRTEFSVILGTGDRFPLVTVGLDDTACPSKEKTKKEKTKALFTAAGNMRATDRVDLFAVTKACDRPTNWVVPGRLAAGAQASAQMDAPVCVPTQGAIDPDFENIRWVTTATGKDGLVEAITASAAGKGDTGTFQNLVLTRHVPRVGGGASAPGSATVAQAVLARIGVSPGDGAIPDSGSPKILVWDVNRDKNLDLVVSTGLRTPGPDEAPTGKLFVLYGDGQGGYAPPVEIKLDVPVANKAACKNLGAVAVVGSPGPGSGTGLFVATTYAPKGAPRDKRVHCMYNAHINPATSTARLTSLELSGLGQVRDLVSADFTGDGVDDIAVVDTASVKLFKGEAKRP